MITDNRQIERLAGLRLSRAMTVLPDHALREGITMDRDAARDLIQSAPLVISLRFAFAVIVGEMEIPEPGGDPLVIRPTALDLYRDPGLTERIPGFGLSDFFRDLVAERAETAAAEDRERAAEAAVREAEERAEEAARTEHMSAQDQRPLHILNVSLGMSRDSVLAAFRAQDTDYTANEMPYEPRSASTGVSGCEVERRAHERSRSRLMTEFVIENQTAGRISNPEELTEDQHARLRAFEAGLDPECKPGFQPAETVLAMTYSPNRRHADRVVLYFAPEEAGGGLTAAIRVIKSDGVTADTADRHDEAQPFAGVPAQRRRFYFGDFDDYRAAQAATGSDIPCTPSGGWAVQGTTSPQIDLMRFADEDCGPVLGAQFLDGLASFYLVDTTILAQRHERWIAAQNNSAADDAPIDF